MGLGLAIGTDALRACKTLPWWRGLLLRWRGAAALPQDLLVPSPRDENIVSVGRFRELVTDVFRQRWLLGRIRVGLPDPSVRVRLLFIDRLPEDPAGRRMYLLWSLADALDFTPERTRLAHMVLPSPLPGRRHVVLCAVTAEKVMQQYERALTESGIRTSGMTPSSIPLFNLFHDHLAASAGSPVLLLAATETGTAAIATLDGIPIFWRTHRVAGRGPELPGASPPASGSWHSALQRQAADAILYLEEELGMPMPARIVVTGPPAADPGLPAWLEAHLKIPVETVDAGRLVRPFPHPLSGEDRNRWEVALGAATHRPLPAGGARSAIDSPSARSHELPAPDLLTPDPHPARPAVAPSLPAPPVSLAQPSASAPGLPQVPRPAAVGNRRSKIYHVPGGRFYQRMATTSKDKVCFASEAEAERAGFRKSKR